MTTLSQRLMRADMFQLTILYFAVLLFTVLTSWPTHARENNSWFILVQIRMMILTLLGLAYGTSVIHKSRLEQHSTLLALIVLGLLSVPLEFACYVASFPPVVWWWSLGITLIDTVAFFGLGIMLSKLLHKIRLQALLPVLNIVVIVLLNTLDFGLGSVTISPLLASTHLSLLHLAVMLVLAGLTGVWFYYDSKE